ncbi:MAG: hypothetical protein Q9219_004858 [cf. Caloplaca sp. 3 TL-2023]
MEVQSEGITEYWGLQSKVTVQRYPRASRRSIQSSKRIHPQGLPATVKNAIATIQEVMFKRRPQDLPCLIYSLCLLNLIGYALKTSASFMYPVAEAGDDVLDALKLLCKLYMFCSNKVHPFVEESDLARYDSLVDNDLIATNHFHMLNRAWRRAGFNDQLPPESSFYTIIDTFAHDMYFE